MSAGAASGGAVTARLREWRRPLGMRRSFVLLVLPSLFLLLGPLTVLLAREITPSPEVQTGMLVIAVLPLLTPMLLRLTGHRWDPLLLSPVWMLCGLGLMVLARVQADLLAAQLLWISLGWCAFIALCGFPPLLTWLRRFRWVWLAAALVLTLSTFVLGADIRGQGAQLWLQLGPVVVQPVEALRVALIAFLAAFLAERGELLRTAWWRFGPVSLPPPTAWVPLAAVMGLSLLAVVAQQDFGPTLIFVASFLALVYLASGRRDLVAVTGTVFVVGGVLAYLASARLQLRFTAWLDPWADPQGVGYQALQAIGGFVFGGVVGAGPGYGYPGLIPAAHTDYPLAALGEEWGLIGTLAVVMLYGLLVARGIARARRTEDAFARLLGAGLAISLGVQVIIIFGGVLRIFPLTGITNPFFSYGGSSMVMGWVMLALLLRAGSGEQTGAPSMRVPEAVLARMRHVGVALLAGFVVLAGTLGYWQVARAADLASDPAVSGQRLRLEEARITRGSLLDRHGTELAVTEIGPDGHPRRVYTERSAVHVVGFDSPWVGAGGAEAYAADALMGRRQDTPADTFRDLMRESRTGSDVRLTVDLELQRAAAEAMNGRPGAAVALDPSTGDVLALVSNPTFDPNFSEEEWAAMRDDPSAPLLNRVTQGLYTPGSTFKTVTLAAAIEQGLVSAESAAACPEEIAIGGVPIVSFNEPPGQSTQNAADAYAYSCNTYFAQLGVDVGADGFAAMSESLGLTGEPPLELPVSGGRLSNEPGFLDTPGGLATSAFGQGELLVSPLHLALMTAAIANDGDVPSPRIFLDDAPSTWRSGMSPETARQVREIMGYSVDAGWAETAGISGLTVGAKSGSAEVDEDGPSNALFVALAPVDDPEIVVAVVLEGAGAGSQQAGPVARAMIEAWAANGGGS